MTKEVLWCYNYLIDETVSFNPSGCIIFISVSRLAKEKFNSNYKVKVLKTPIEE